MTQTFIYALIAAISQVVGALIFVQIHQITDRLRYVVLAISAGFLLSLTFLELLPVAFTAGTNGPLVTLAGFFLVLILQMGLNPGIIHTHHLEENPDWITNHAHLQHLTRGNVWILPVGLGLAIHSLFDGVLIESAHHVAPDYSLAAFWAVFIHKFPVGLTLAAILSVLGYGAGIALLSATFLGLMTLVGTIAMHGLAAFSSYGLALSAGSLLYVCTVEFVPIVYHAPERKYMFLVILGLFTGWLIF